MPKLTLKFLEAQVEALTTRCKALEDRVETCEKRERALFHEVAMVRDAKSDVQRVSTRGRLMQHAKQLAASGVPCYVRGEAIFDAKTHAPIALEE